MFTFVRRGIAIAILALVPQAVLAHNGEDHSAPAAAAPVPIVQVGSGADGSSFQAVLVPAADGHSLLYLAEVDSNAPVVHASVEVEAEGWKGTAAPTQHDGVYRLDWAPPAQGADVMLTVLAGGRDDLILITGVQLPIPPAEEDAATAHWTHWTGGAAIGGVLVLVTALMMRRRKPVTSAAVVLAALLMSGQAFAHGGEDHGAPAAAPAPEPGTVRMLPKSAQFLLGIRTEKVAAKESADTVRVVGRVVPDPAGFAKVQPSQPARVVGDAAFPLPVPGQAVRRGQVIAVLEPTLTSLERSDKRASLYRIESEIAIQERELSRLESLGSIVPAKTVENTRIRLDQLRRERNQIASTALGRDLVTAPVDGVVTDVHVVPGQVVSPETVMVEIVDPTRLRVEAIIHDLAMADRISGGAAATKLVPDTSFPLTLLGVSPRVDAIDQGVHAIFAVAPDQARRLKIGLPVDVYLSTGATRLSTAVPRGAIAEVGGRQVVFVRTAPEAFEARPINVRQVVGPLAEVEGVRAGDRVVIQGVEQLKAAR